MKNNFGNNIPILEQMENNFKRINLENNAKQENTNNNSPNNNNNLNGNRNISNLMPLFNMLNGKPADFQTMLKNPEITKLLGNTASNPMLSQIMSLMPNMIKSQNVKQQKQEKNEPKIDSFIKVDDYNIE